jgi:hypothetical protein
LLPVPGAPAAGQVLIEVLFAPVNHNDLLVMGDRFTYHPELPAVLGNEAVGRIPAAFLILTFAYLCIQNEPSKNRVINLWWRRCLPRRVLICSLSNVCYVMLLN